MSEKNKPLPDTPREFGYKCQWLAVKTDNVYDVVSAINLQRVKPSNWEEGLAAAYVNRVFISPVLDGWILIIGNTLPDAGDETHPDKATPLLIDLSRKFGEAHYYGTHRVVEYHAWAKARNGEIVRAYAYIGDSGTTQWNNGAKTDEEIELKFSFFDETSADAEGPDYWENENLRFPNENDVIAIASRWSIDPLFRNSSYEPALGVLGDFRLETQLEQQEELTQGSISEVKKGRMILVAAIIFFSIVALLLVYYKM